MTKPTTPGIAELLDAFESDVRWACSEDWFGMDPVAAVESSRANILAHVADLEREAARYRWLRDEADWSQWEACYQMLPENLDASIDRAIAQRGGNDV